MASLTGNQINNSYQGLLKTVDNGPATTQKVITDGEGNPLPMDASTSGINISGESRFSAGPSDIFLNPTSAAVEYTGDHDFSSATVTGLPITPAGLVNGAGESSLKNADSLVTTPATASAACSIAIGNGACALDLRDVAIGTNSRTTLDGDGGKVAIGENNAAINESAVAIGRNNIASYQAIAIGIGNQACNGFVIGRLNLSTGNGNIIMGNTSCATSSCGIVFGELAKVTSTNAIAMGRLSLAAGPDSIALGRSSCVSVAGASFSIAIGQAACVTQTEGIAIGFSAKVTSTYSVAIGGGSCASGSTSFALGGGTLTSGAEAIAIGDSATSTARAAIAIGGALATKTCATAVCSIAIGHQARSSATCSIAFGRAACVTLASTDGISIGRDSCVTAIGAVAIGEGVTAARAQTVTVKELQTQVAGGGITLKSADLSEEKVTLTDSDVLAVGGDTIPANDTATPTIVNRFWSGSQAQYDALVAYDANTIYFIA